MYREEGLEISFSQLAKKTNCAIKALPCTLMTKELNLPSTTELAVPRGNQSANWMILTESHWGSSSARALPPVSKAGALPAVRGTVEPSPAQLEWSRGWQSRALKKPHLLSHSAHPSPGASPVQPTCGTKLGMVTRARCGSTKSILQMHPSPK